MGSQLVKALIHQVAKFKTNPDERNPEVSKPIFQFSANVVSTFQGIEQRNISSSPNVGLASPSRPIHQLSELKAPDPLGDEGLLEQKNLTRSTQGDKTPVEQLGFTNGIFSGRIDNNSTQPIQQRTLGGSATSSVAVEQVAQMSNTINIQQFDFIDLIFPACNSIRNPVDTNILVRLRNFGFAFNLASLVFKVNGLDVQNAPSFIITPIVNGVQLDYNPPENFEYKAAVDIFIQIQDVASIPRTFIFKCTFFTTPDTVGPRVQNFGLCNQADVDSRAVVAFDVVDLETGVNPDSIRLSIEGIEVCEGVSITELTASGTSGFHVTWTHNDLPFRYGSKVTAAVSAEDTAVPPNGTLFVCRFQVEESIPPEFIIIDPEPCDSFVDNTTGLFFEVYGVEHGVDISTLEVRIDSRSRRVYVRPRIRRVE